MMNRGRKLRVCFDEGWSELEQAKIATCQVYLALQWPQEKQNLARVCGICEESQYQDEERRT